MGRLILGLIIAFLFIAPMNWIRLFLTDTAPHGATLAQFLIGTTFFWGLSLPLAKWFLYLNRRAKLKRDEELERRQLMAADRRRRLDQINDLPLVEIRPSKALLKPNEKAYCAIPASLQAERTIGYSGSSNGVSIRVARGVTVRTGKSRAKAVRKIVSIAEGELVVTDQRLIFAGDRKSLSLPLKSLVNVANYSDGFGLSSGSTTHRLLTGANFETEMFATILNRIIQR